MQTKTSMFDELWLIKDGICLYYDKWTDTPLSLDPNLFSAFMSALKTFQETSFPDQQLKSLDMFNTRLTYLNSKYFYLTVREPIHKPIERTYQQLKNIAEEIENLINSRPELKFISNNLSSNPLERYHSIIGPVINDILEVEEIAESQLKSFDFITLTYIAREIRDLILKIAPHGVLINIARTQKNQWFYDLIMSDSSLEPNLFTKVTYQEIIDYMNDFFTQTERNFKLYEVKPNPEKLEATRKDLISFLAINSQIISRFNLIDTILSKFVLLFK